MPQPHRYAHDHNNVPGPHHRWHLLAIPQSPGQGQQPCAQCGRDPTPLCRPDERSHQPEREQRLRTLCLFVDGTRWFHRQYRGHHEPRTGHLYRNGERCRMHAHGELQCDRARTSHGFPRPFDPPLRTEHQLLWWQQWFDRRDHCRWHRPLYRCMERPQQLQQRTHRHQRPLCRRLYDERDGRERLHRFSFHHLDPGHPSTGIDNQRERG